jgi:hypothetical protein
MPFRSLWQLLTLVVVLLTMLSVVFLAVQLKLPRSKSDAGTRTSADSASKTQHRFSAL